MTQPFIGQIQPFSFNFAPRGWAMCNGQLMSVSQNTALFALIGTYYGGNGTSTFALPNLQSRAPMGQGAYQGNTYTMGEIGGLEGVTLNINQIPMHSHAFFGTADQGDENPPTVGAALAAVHKNTPPADSFYAADTNALQPINPGTVSPVGGNTPHENLQPYLVLNWCIATVGIFPSRN
ncbi:MAG TPA: tail fiber protein [Rhizomicrobium sp.]